MKIQLILAAVLFLCGFCKCNLTESLIPTESASDALIARLIILAADWVSVASISTQEDIKNYPFVSAESIGITVTNHDSTGIPYLYVTPMDVTTKNLEANPKVTVMHTMAQTDFCKTKNYDTQDPRCSTVFITGKFVKVETTSPEHQFAKDSLLKRHPQMKDWPKDRGFYVAKIDPTKIQLLDGYGGVKEVSVKDYLEESITFCDLLLF